MNEKARLVLFVRGCNRINVYYTTSTVATVFTQPGRGLAQLFCVKVDVNMLSQLFHNPRIHTGHGYYDARGKSCV